MTKYFIGVVTKNHVMKGVENGFAQIGHGKRSGLARMNKDDWLIYYSPKETLESKEPFQKFTAIGEVIDNNIYQGVRDDGFMPFRRNINYLKAQEVPIQNLLEKLSFIKDKTHWGYVFRFGIVEIPKDDFDLIKNAMTSSIPDSHLFNSIDKLRLFVS